MSKIIKGGRIKVSVKIYIYRKKNVLVFGPKIPQHTPLIPKLEIEYLARYKGLAVCKNYKY
jgi:hypothetical protein